jgi:hypothetical protein
MLAVLIGQFLGIDELIVQHFDRRNKIRLTGTGDLKDQ